MREGDEECRRRDPSDLELISSAKRNQLFESSAQDAFHLELRDDYFVPDEDSPFTDWLRGESVDYSYIEPWMQLIRRVTSEGETGLPSFWPSDVKLLEIVPFGLPPGTCEKIDPPDWIDEIKPILSVFEVAFPIGVLLFYGTNFARLGVTEDGN
ncbi:DUF6879 family protein [Streptomyces sp. NBC_01314]|uniref:DUF6879 family protein n=1 Tax=Streptomyces sp. NBC_01314 TaxID=2903821 RepID=UPI00309362E7|nr:hypothetical protein OG622_35710 [Streptomyces sp. NBC_01314]